jgi:signal transduction histidine kinase/CheY-like chemotaxis protein
VPIRAYLGGLAVLFVLAAGAAIVYSRVQSGQDTQAAAQADAAFAARLAAGELGSGVTALQQTVESAAANPGMGKVYDNPEDCGLSFGGTDAYTRGHIDVVRTDGSLVCSSLKGAPGGYDASEWVRKAPVLAAKTPDPLTGQPSVLAAAPVPGRGIVLAVFYLDGIGPSLAQSYGGPRGLEFLLTDGKGTTLSGHPPAGDALTATATVPGAGWQVTATADKQEALADTRRLNRRELTIILIGLLLILAATWFVHRRIALPLARLKGQMHEGPLHVNVEGPAEVAALATRLNELSEALAREQEAYHALFDGSPLPTWVHDTESRRILEANDAAVAAYGYTHDELLALQVEALERGPGVHERKDGTLMEVSVAEHAISFRGRDACVVIAEDVTEKERLRHQLQQSQRLESLGQLAGGVAHDFNNLLAVILGYAGFIEKRAAGGSADARDVKQIIGAGERATRLTRQLLAFARREVVRPTVLDLTGVVLEMEQMLRRTIGEHVRLETSLAPDLWPVMADYGQLEQVLVNLAINARDAMPEGGSLTLDTENVAVDGAYAATRPGLPAGRYARLRVSDTGIGMAPEVVARAFEPFFTTKPKGQGTGLGLATIHGIVTGAGGHVQIYSEPDLGTTITVLLPATDVPAADDHHVTPVITPSGGGETVLVVEDEPAMLEVTRRILDANGYEVLIAGSGLEAIRLAEEHTGAIDVLLTDVVMPQMLGREVADRVAARRANLRVLFMSGYAQSVIGPMGELSGGREIIDKPFTEAALMERLQALLASPAAP